MRVRRGSWCYIACAVHTYPHGNDTRTVHRIVDVARAASAGEERWTRFQLSGAAHINFV